MDPKTNAPLDPKLKEAYDKVMSFSASNNPSSPVPPTPAQPASPMAPIPAPVAELPTPPATPVTPSSPSLIEHVVTPSSAPLDASATPVIASPPETTAPTLPTPPTLTPSPTVMVGGQPTGSTQHQMNAKKKKGVSPILLGLGGFIFLIIYAFVCIKIINVHVPYINP